MLDKLRKIPDAYRNWRSSIEGRELERDEIGLQEAAFMLTQMITRDRRIPEAARALKRKYSWLPKEELPFVTYASLLIPDSQDYNVEQLRTVFGRGTFRLYKRKSLNELARENNITWRDCIRIYRQASFIAFDNQIKQAKLELTGRET